MLMDFYAQGHEKGGFEKGIETGLQRILSSPQFVFRFERDPANAADGAYAISDCELASRSRSSSGAASPTTSCSSSRAATG